MDLKTPFPLFLLHVPSQRQPTLRDRHTVAEKLATDSTKEKADRQVAMGLAEFIQSDNEKKTHKISGMVQPLSVPCLPRNSVPLKHPKIG